MSWGIKFLRGNRADPKPAAERPTRAAPAAAEGVGEEAPALSEALAPLSETAAPTLSVQDAEALLVQGGEAADAGDFDRARELYQEVEGSGALAEWAAFRIGLLERGRGDEAAAEAAFGRAIGRAPDLFWAHYERLALRSVRTDLGRRDRHVEALLEIAWQPLEAPHVVEFDATALAVWRDGKRDLAGRLLARLFPLDALGADLLARIVETAPDPALIEAASSVAPRCSANSAAKEPCPARRRASKAPSTLRSRISTQAG